MKVKEAIAALQALPQDGELLCQVVDQQGNAWNMWYEFEEVYGRDWLVQLRVFHPELQRLPLIGVELARNEDAPR